jgi:hypothetical protein
MRRPLKILVTALSAISVAAPLRAQAPPNTATRQRGYVASMKSDLRILATAEEAYFMDSNGSYYSGTVSASQPLVGFKPAPNITINVVTGADGHEWTATATHALTPTKCTYHLPDPPVCDPLEGDTPGLATPRDGSLASDATAGPRTTTIGGADSVKIRPGRSHSWQFEVRPPQTLCTVTGQVLGLAGGDQKVVVLLMTEFAYDDWTNNRPARTYFESSPRTEIPFDINIEGEGHYRLVVWNQSTTSPVKTVQLQQGQVACHN